MKRYIYEALAVGLIIVLASPCFAQYNPVLGRFHQRDPLGIRPGQATFVNGAPYLAGNNGTLVGGGHMQPDISPESQGMEIESIARIQKNNTNKLYKSHGHIHLNQSSATTDILDITISSNSVLNIDIDPIMSIDIESGVDPIYQYQDGMNLYQYCFSNPCIYIDPYGLCAIQYKEKGIGHSGFLIEGNDYDFGPRWFKDKPVPVGAGSCPWQGNNVNANTDFASKKELIKKESGMLSHVTRDGQPVNCSCATCDEVHKCIAEECKRWNNVPFLFIFPNCRSFVDITKSKCCLGSK